MQSSGWFYRCPCGWETHEYTNEALYARVVKHHRWHRVELAQITGRDYGVQAGQEDEAERSEA